MENILIHLVLIGIGESRKMAEIKSRAVEPEKTDKEILADIKTYNEKRIK